MDFDQIKRRAWFSGSLVALLGALGLVMAVLQYRWTGELSRAEQERLGEALQRSLLRLSHDLNEDLAAAVAALQPNGSEVAERGREGAYAARFARWHAANGGSRLFQHIGLAVPEDKALKVEFLSQENETFESGEWPADWAGLRDQIASRLRGERVIDSGTQQLLFEIPRFGPSSPSGPMTEQEWLIVQLDAGYIRDVLLARQIARHLPSGGATPYQVEVYSRADGRTVFRSGLAEGETIKKDAQASIRILQLPRLGAMGPPMGSPKGMGGRGRRFEHEHRPPPPGSSAAGPGPGPRRPGGPPEQGLWEMYVRPPGGSLEALVERTRWRNLGLALTLIILIVATALLLVRSARQAQQLAEIQMNFVSSVSHELRTPLTVIRTAAFNLRGRVAAKPDQVERYGKLIQEQSEKLGALVEQVLRYASSRVGQVIHEREAVVIDDVIEGGIRSSQLALDNSPYEFEKQIDPNLPLVLADERALQHVIQNLVDNAVKYGTETNNWIGLSVRQAGDFLEICVADRGPGIPVDEQALVFDPFFRGRRALADQINGTGLGLNLVKKIVEAHGGTIRVQNHAPQGAEFIVRVPVAPPEMQDEFAHTTG